MSPAFQKGCHKGVDPVALQELIWLEQQLAQAQTDLDM